MAEPTLGGVTLTNASVADLSEVFVGKQERAHDGTLLTDYTNVLKAWHIKCEILTASQLNAITAKTDLLTSQTFVDVTGTSYTATVKRGTPKVFRSAGATIYYAIEFDIEEAS